MSNVRPHGELLEHLADLASLVEFFGVEPKMEYPDVPFEQNAVEFDVDLAPTNVWFSFFAPGGFAELRLRGTPFSIVKLNFSDITNLSIRKTAEDHYLHLKFGSKEVESLALHLRPHVLLFWGNSVGPEDSDHLEPVNEV
jgi:hypothetical protein